MFFPALIAKIASTGAIAQAAAGAGIVVVAFTGAGVAGALPDSLQHGFATVASTVGIQVEDPQQTDDVVPTTPSTPTPDGTEVDGSDDTPAAGDVTDAPVTDDDYTFEDWKAGPEDGESFGDWVSKGARHGYADGAIISQKAHEKGVVLPTETAEPTDEAEQTSPPSSASHGHGNGSNRGPGGSGSGAGGGNGNGGHGSRHGNG